MMHQSRDAEERRFHRRNWLIEIRARIPEVIDDLQSRPFAVLPDTIQRLGLRENFYLFGAQLRPENIPHLERLSGLVHCHFRAFGPQDIPLAGRLRAA